MVTKQRISPARAAAYDILRRVEAGAYSSILLAQETELDIRDRSLCHELVLGVLRQQLWLDRLAQRFLKANVSSLDNEVLLILRLGLYQLRYLKRIPASAVVNESVNLAHRGRLRSAGALVNAVLRRAAREPDIDPVSDLTDPIEKLAVASSHPSWLIERWISAFGEVETASFVAANNQPATISFRLVHQRTSETEIIALLRAEGADPLPSTVVAGAWKVNKRTPALSEAANRGEIYFQDAASQLVPKILDPRAGERVLDLCAAPGSKTTQIADLMAGAGIVVASDLHHHRLRVVTESARLQHLKNVRCLVLDGLQALPFENTLFDKVLVDAPCSGTGTLRRNPEIRWRISAHDIQDLSARQKALLDNAAAIVRPGGKLVYSTCSVEPEEDESVARMFLENHINFSLIELPQANGSLPGTRRTWPHHGDTDGFFVAAFQREG